MVIVRGVNLYPAAVDEVLRRFPEVVEYQVQVRQPQGLAEVTLELEPAPGCADPAALAARVQAELQAVFALRVPVTFVPPGTLPRFELKARRWVRC
jgi:phenylacetate-CoA ligase